MTQDEIIAMTREAGFDEHHAQFDLRIERFAKLVAAHEREACAKVCDSFSDDPVYCGELIRARGQQ